MEKTDCFAYNASKKDCNCLRKLYCKKEECSFYKNKADVNLLQIERDIRNYVYVKK